MYWLYNVVVNSAEYYDRVENIVERTYGRWLHLSNHLSAHSYNIVLNITDHSAYYRLKSPNIIEIGVIRKNINNARKLVNIIEKGRSYLRNYVVWDEDKKTYKLWGEGVWLENYEIKPAYDIFLALGTDFYNILREKGLDPPLHLLLNKRFGGEYHVYDGELLHGKLFVPDEGFGVLAVKLKPRRNRANDLASLLNENKEVLLIHETIARYFLESLGKPDIVVVSFSGGKDSLAVLHLATTHYGSDNVLGIYVDTGVDFPHVRGYVNKVAEELGVRVETVRADIDRLIPRRGMPTRDNRWCTLRKTSAFKKKLRTISKKYDKVLVLVGDRDSESLVRSKKPPVRRRRWYLEAAPIKQWSTLLVQLYAIKYNLPMNPLYLKGFYRLGCYICPALTSLERYVMLNKLYEDLRGLPWFKQYISSGITN